MSGSLVQMKALQADLKAKAMTLADTERIGLNSYIANAEKSLGNPYAALNAIEMGATGARASETGNAQLARGVKANGALADDILRAQR